MEGSCHCEELCSFGEAPQEMGCESDPEKAPVECVGAETDVKVYRGEELFAVVTDGFTLPYSRDGTSLIEIPEMLVEHSVTMPDAGELRIVCGRPTGELTLDGVTLLSVGSEEYDPVCGRHLWRDVRAQFGDVVPSPTVGKILETTGPELTTQVALGPNHTDFTVSGTGYDFDQQSETLVKCPASETGEHEAMTASDMVGMPGVETTPNVTLDQIVATADGGIAQCDLFVCRHCHSVFLGGSPWG